MGVCLSVLLSTRASCLATERSGARPGRSDTSPASPCYSNAVVQRVTNASLQASLVRMSTPGAYRLPTAARSALVGPGPRWRITASNWSRSSVGIESASLNLKNPFGLSLSKPCAALRQAQRERFKLIQAGSIGMIWKWNNATHAVPAVTAVPPRASADAKQGICYEKYSCLRLLNKRYPCFLLNVHCHLRMPVGPASAVAWRRLLGLAAARTAPVAGLPVAPGGTAAARR